MNQSIDFEFSDDSSPAARRDETEQKVEISKSFLLLVSKAKHSRRRILMDSY